MATRRGGRGRALHPHQARHVVPAPGDPLLPRSGGPLPQDIDHFALSRNPRANLGKRVAHAIKDRAGRQVATRRAGNLRKILNAKQTLADGLGVPPTDLKAKPHFVEHHLAHIASSYYVSPFEPRPSSASTASAT